MYISHHVTQRNSKSYTHHHHIDMCTARGTLLLQHIDFELADDVAGWVVFTNDVPVPRQLE